MLVLFTFASFGFFAIEFIDLLEFVQIICVVVDNWKGGLVVALLPLLVDDVARV